ncbi:MAG: hypothetical protein JWO67_6716 [Streptosporangiaceae bacterium]|nr:hypothetical protein [Streptosporangiaceae bacterium]
MADEVQADKVKVRVSMHPDRDIEVSPDEVPVLRRQGILVEDDAKPTAARAGSRSSGQAAAGGSGDGAA